MSTINMIPSGDGSVNNTNTHGTSNLATTLGRLSTSTLSMRNKKQLKRHASAHHNSNFQAGYVPVTEDVLHRTGIRGRKRYFLYCILAVLFFVAFINTLVTAYLLFILGMTPNGVGSFETVNLATRSFFHIFTPAFAPSFVLNGAPFGSRYNRNMSLTSQNYPITISSFTSSKFAPNMTLNNDTINVFADHMCIKTHGKRKTLSLDVESFAATYGISNYQVQNLMTRKIQNYKDVNDLYLESPLKKVKVNGSKGVDVKSIKHMEINGRDILVESDKSVVFKSKQSLYLDPSLGQVTNFGSNVKADGNKVCVCGNGRVFFSVLCDIGKDMALSVCHS